MVLTFPGGGHLVGWSYFWGWYVTGFNPEQHCQKCFFGYRSQKVKNGMRINDPIVLDEHPDADFFYLCGGDEGWDYNKNFHLALRYNPDFDTRAKMSTGTPVLVTNSQYIEIPPLEIGFNGKDRKFTTCRNYQFGVQAYQLGLDGRPLRPNSDGTFGFKPEPTPEELAAHRRRRAEKSAAGAQSRMW